LSISLPVAFPNLFHKRVGERGSAVVFSSRKTVTGITSAFGVHISGIIAPRSKKEVRRSNARRIVATVENMQIQGNGSVNQLPHESVSGDFLLGYRYLPIPTTRNSRPPDPTPTLRRIKLLQEVVDVHIHRIERNIMHNLKAYNLFPVRTRGGT
jgi:hypothetical protein